MNSPAPPTAYLRRGTPEYGRTARALFAAGFVCFAMIYVVQGVLPDVSRDFGVSPAAASLTVSLTTLPLAVAVIVVASYSEGYGRRRLLVGALFLGSVLTVASAASPAYPALLGFRVLTGCALAGLPAVAMAYVGEEVDRASLGAAMGLYISATGLGGMTGRWVGGLVAGALSWRWALVVIGLVGLVGSLWVAMRLPPSRHFVPRPARLGVQLRELRVPLRDRVLLVLYACGFALMGGNVAYYNYLQYRLHAPPFSLPSTAVAMVFLLYLCGTVSANWMGRRTDRHTRRSVLLLGLIVMLAGVVASVVESLPVVLLATAVLTFGFFGAHAVASGWVNAQATSRRAQASALYLLFYYIGSSVIGFVAGLFLGGYGWYGLAGMLAVLVAAATVLAARLPSTTRGAVRSDAT
ncbi:MAG: MFS transporter [Streptosporangiaceae bacterium]